MRCMKWAVSIEGICDWVIYSMINDRTTVIVGAGASVGFGLPAGGEIKSRIAQLLDIKFENAISQVSGDYLIMESIKKHFESEGGTEKINEFIKSARKTSAAMPLAISIDNYIDSNRNDRMVELCGKLAICRAILESERKSSLWFDERNDELFSLDPINLNWIVPFFQLISENATSDELAERLKRITLIVFNYDRCIEHSLFHCIKNYYEIPSHIVADILSNLDIFHPYGKVGKLPWEGDGSTFDFGYCPSPDELLELSSKIRTFTEGTDPNSSEIELLRERLLQSSMLIFLGFAYHSLNMELLSVSSMGEQPVWRVFGTALGISLDDRDIISQDIRNLAPGSDPKINLRAHMKCDEFFQEFWRTFSLSR